MAASPQHLMFETTDCDRAGEYLTGIYGTGLRMTGRKRGYSFRHTRLATDAFAVDSSTQTDQITYTMEPVPTLLIGRPRSMIMTYRSGRAEYRFGPGDVFLASHTEDSDPFEASWDNGAMQATSLPFPLLAQVASTAETRPRAPIRFTDLIPVSPAAGGQLISTIDHVTRSLRDYPDVAAEPLVAGASGRLLTAAVLCAFPNTALLEVTTEDRHDAHSRTLRRAIAFIDDHAHEDVSVADIAAAAHVTIRALQYAFRRHHGTTPTEYLRRARLAHAHRELLAADPTAGATVTRIAARWGFLHPGRFARYYRGVYGRSPQQTLLRDAH